MTLVQQSAIYLSGNQEGVLLRKVCSLLEINYYLKRMKEEKELQMFKLIVLKTIEQNHPYPHSLAVP